MKIDSYCLYFLSVVEATAAFDDNSTVALATASFEALRLDRGDTVLVKGKRRTDFPMNIINDNTLPAGSIRMNRNARSNLHIRPGDTVTVFPFPHIENVKFRAVI
jgi:hypothetical protein